MKRYRLLKDLPYVKAGEEMEMWSDGTIAFTNHPDLPRFNKKDVQMFPLWFEEIKATPSEYYYITDDGNVDFVVEEEPNLSRRRKAIGNIFETEEEAKKYLECLKAKAIIKQDTKGFKPNWQNINETKYFGFWDLDEDKLDYLPRNIFKEASIYFKSREDIEESFKKHPDEWKTYLTYEG